MSKEVMLKRAFNQASANGAVRFVDRDVDFAVIRNYMVQYAKKNDVEVSEKELHRTANDSDERDHQRFHLSDKDDELMKRPRIAVFFHILWILFPKSAIV
ncbi:hypothetical protein [Emergencia timonensis]